MKNHRAERERIDRRKRFSFFDPDFLVAVFSVVIGNRKISYQIFKFFICYLFFNLNDFANLSQESSVDIVIPITILAVQS